MLLTDLLHHLTEFMALGSGYPRGIQWCGNTKTAHGLSGGYLRNVWLHQNHQKLSGFPWSSFLGFLWRWYSKLTVVGRLLPGRGSAGQRLEQMWSQGASMAEPWISSRKSALNGYLSTERGWSKSNSTGSPQESPNFSMNQQHRDILEIAFRAAHIVSTKSWFG